MSWRVVNGRVGASKDTKGAGPWWPAPTIFAMTKLTNDHGLLMHKGRPVSHLLVSLGKVCEASLGMVNATPEEAAQHNKLLDQMLINGLDTCQIGQGYFFYLTKEDGKHVVTGWTGALVSNDVDVTATTITFRRNGMTFHGRRSKHGNFFKFKRTK